MKKNAGKITIAVLLLMASMIIAYVITPAFAVVRSYNQDVQAISMTTVMTGSNDDMFTVTGGPIEVISLFGQVTTILAGASGNLSIVLDSAVDANYDADFTVVIDAANGRLGDVFTFGALVNA